MNVVEDPETSLGKAFVNDSGGSLETPPAYSEKGHNLIGTAPEIGAKVSAKRLCAGNSSWG